MKILFLCTYPIENPRHGGQLRVRNIVDVYRASGHDVEVRGVLGSEHYEAEVGFLPFPKIDDLNAIISKPFLMEDYAIGRLFAEDTKHYERLVSLIKSQPDAIHVEQPWLYAFARRYIESRKSNIKLVYGSQNIEWQLKRQILSSYIDTDSVSRNVELIKSIELEAINTANAIIAVSQTDHDWIRSRTEAIVVLAPNGVRPWFVTEEGCKQALRIIKGFDYALYCASAHPPNMTGFFDMFSEGFGSLKPDEKLVIVGGAGWAITKDVRLHHSPKLAEKIIVAGVVDQSCLEGLLEGAKCIVLPLTQGGGTNLKTAEALWAGKHIVATSIAMRGFEQYINSNGVHIADDPVSFKRKVRDSMCAETLKLTDEEIAERKDVLWENCLVPLVKLMDNFDLNNGVI